MLLESSNITECKIQLETSVFDTVGALSVRRFCQLKCKKPFKL